MPDNTGKPIAPKRTSDSTFGLVACVADLDRQEHMYAMGGEMIGIISGLLLPLPLELFKDVEDNSEAYMDWGLLPSEDQLYNALCLLSFALLFVGVLMGTQFPAPVYKLCCEHESILHTLADVFRGI